MQFLPTPIWIVVCGEIAWLSSHGAAGISYALFNVTMKKELLKIFCSGVQTSPTVANTPNAPNAPNAPNVKAGGSGTDTGLQLNF